MRAIRPEELEQCIRRHLPSWRQELHLVPIPTGKFNESYFVQTEGKELVLRIAPALDSVFVFYERRMMRQEPELHRLLLAKTSVPVAPIIAHDESHEIIDRDFLIMERLPGAPLSETSGVDTDDVYREVGRCLAETHALTREQYGYLGPHAPMEPQDTWHDAFHTMWNQLVADVAGSGYYDDLEERYLRYLLKSHTDVFQREIPASLLHMDVWAQNLLVSQEGNLTGIVDWDRALWGDPEIEFAVLDYCGVSVPAFWEGYGRQRELSPEAQVRRIFYLLYELQKYIVIRHGRNLMTEEAQRYKEQVVDVVRNAFGRWAR